MQSLKKIHAWAQMKVPLLQLCQINIMKEVSVKEMTNMVKLACVICLKHFSG